MGDRQPAPGRRLSIHLASRTGRDHSRRARRPNAGGMRSQVRAREPVLSYGSVPAVIAFRAERRLRGITRRCYRSKRAADMGPSAADRLRKTVIFNGGERVSDSSVELSVTSNVRSSGLFALHGRRHEVTAQFSVRLCWSVRTSSHPKQGPFSPAPIEHGVSAYRNVVGNPAIST